LFGLQTSSRQAKGIDIMVRFVFADAIGSDDVIFIEQHIEAPVPSDRSLCFAPVADITLIAIVAYKPLVLVINS
jgi:hypothetical protein